MNKIKVHRKIITNVNIKRMLLAEIPIYRCPKTNYIEEFNKNEKKHIKKLDIPKDSHAYNYATRYYHNKNWHTWEYNEIIGWLRIIFKSITFNKNEINFKFEGQLFFVKEQVSKRLKRKTFKRDIESFFELEFNEKDFLSLSSSDVFHEINTSILTAIPLRKLDKYFIDMTFFQNICKIINWENALNLL